MKPCMLPWTQTASARDQHSISVQALEIKLFPLHIMQSAQWSAPHTFAYGALPTF